MWVIGEIMFFASILLLGHGAYNKGLGKGCGNKSIEKKGDRFMYIALAIMLLKLFLSL